MVDASPASDRASFERRAVAVLKSLFAVAALLLRCGCGSCSFRNLFEDGVRAAVVDGGTVDGVGGWANRLRPRVAATPRRVREPLGRHRNRLPPRRHGKSLRVKRQAHVLAQHLHERAETPRRADVDVRDGVQDFLERGRRVRDGERLAEPRFDDETRVGLWNVHLDERPAERAQAVTATAESRDEAAWDLIFDEVVVDCFCGGVGETVEEVVKSCRHLRVVLGF